MRSHVGVTLAAENEEGKKNGRRGYSSSRQMRGLSVGAARGTKPLQIWFLVNIENFLRNSR